tara:strand:+ start:4918 stop:5178 length:261 start_codon:yes stop_codon:yes gene_type:complete
MVQLDAGEYLLEMLMDAGPVKQMAMGGVGALGWGDLLPYFNLTYPEVEGWEARWIIGMSEAFAKGMDEGKSLASKAPMDRQQEATP